MSDINSTILNEVFKPSIKEGEYLIPLFEDDELYIIELAKPELSEGEYAVAMKDKHRERRLNPRTNRMKKFKTTKWMITKIPPEERSLKNLPRYADKSAKVKFQDWLGLKSWGDPHSTGMGTDNKFYGWSHRAIHGFYVGELIKSADVIGNKYTYGKDIDEKYNRISNKYGYQAADTWRKELPFKQYTIKTDDDAKAHAERFARDVS